MRRFAIALVTGAALSIGFSQVATAADLAVEPVYKAAVVAPPVYNWTGIYVGAHAGGGWGDKEWVFIGTGQSTSHNVDGWLAGLQAGFNWQIGRIVLGIEGQYSWANLDGSSPCPNPAFSCQTEVDWLATVAGRFGFAFNNWLLYGKAGWAGAGDDYIAVLIAGPAANDFLGSENRSGWMAGLGIEWGFWNNWSAKLEWNHMDFGTKLVQFSNRANPANTDNFDNDQTIDIVKFGINYRFNWVP